LQRFFGTEIFLSRNYTESHGITTQSETKRKSLSNIAFATS
jgi:hypothetical protein